MTYQSPITPTDDAYLTLVTAQQLVGGCRALCAQLWPLVNSADAEIRQRAAALWDEVLLLHAQARAIIDGGYDA